MKWIHKGCFGFGLLWMVSTLAGAADPATKPASEPRTYHDVVREQLVYWRERMVGDYQRVGRRHEKWDAAAVEFLEAFASYKAVAQFDPFYTPADTPALADVDKLGQQVVRMGCDDPLVFVAARSTFARQMHAQGNRYANPAPQFQNMKFCDEMYRALIGSEYAHHIVGEIADDHTKATWIPPDTMKQTAPMLAERWIQACCEQPAPKQRRLVTIGVWNRCVNRDEEAAVVAALRRQENVDPYVLHHVLGRYHRLLGWDLRGRGWADTVTEEGWKGFFANLKVARQHLMTAWKLDPSLPQAPADMIVVAMGGGETLGEDPLDWFDHATRAQVDYKFAYEAVRQALLPRWGGSYEQMMQLAEVCLVNPRYNTVIPLQFVETLSQIGSDAGRPLAALSDEANFLRVCEVYAKCAEHSPRMAAYLRSAWASLALKVGDVEMARGAVDALKHANQLPDPKGFALYGIDDPALAISEIYTRTGPQREALDAVMLKVNAKKFKEALDDVERLKAALKADSPEWAFVQKLQTMISQMTGTWSDIKLDPAPREGGLKNWKEVFGIHRVRIRAQSVDQQRRGMINGHPFVGDRPGAPAVKLAVWDDGALNISRAADFEVKGTFYFYDTREPQNPNPMTLAKPGQQSTGGFAFFEPNTKAVEFAFLDYGRKKAGFAVEGKIVQEWDAEVKSETKLRVKVVDGQATLFVNEKQIGDPHTLGPPFARPYQLGVGGPDGLYFEFNNVSVRNLLE